MRIEYSILSGIITTYYSPQDIDNIFNEELDGEVNENHYERPVGNQIDPETDFHHRPKITSFDYLDDHMDIEEEPDE